MSCSVQKVERSPRNNVHLLFAISKDRNEISSLSNDEKRLDRIGSQSELISNGC
jgi:hypothetical protein